MERWVGRVALVTGASAGIGAAICRQLVKHGMHVIGCARNDQQVQALAAELQGAPGSLTAIHCDLTQSDQIEAMFATIQQKFGGVDVCVNNAGFSYEGSLLEGSVDQWKTMLSVNVLAAAHCSQLAVRSVRMRDVADGQVVNINSICGAEVIPLASFHFYCATKHALTALTVGLRQEMAQTTDCRVRVAQISPGAVSTSFFDRMLSNKDVVRQIESVGMDPREISDALCYILATPPNVQVRDMVLEPLMQRSE